MVDEINIGALLIELFVGYWYIWLIVMVVGFIFLMVMFKITDLFGRLWNYFRTRKNRRYEEIKVTNWYENGIVVKATIHIPKKIIKEPDAIHIEDILAEVENK